MNTDLPVMLQRIQHISKKAGDIILGYYPHSHRDIVIKDDNSPLTEADMASDECINAMLNESFHIPVISEENFPEYEIRKDYQDFFLVDPLDGTKEFIEGTDEFTVNIAYIKKNKPVLGVVHAPALGLTFSASENSGSYLENARGIKRLPLDEKGKQVPTAIGSRKHSTDLDSEFLEMNGITKVIPVGSSLKFCYLAMGYAQVYPRFQGSMEWDIAAGHIIAKEAGCTVVDLKTRQEPVYNTQSLRNNYFIVFGKGIDPSTMIVPDSAEQ